MQVNQYNNSPQFKGSFLINYKKALPEMRNAFENVLGAHKGLIYDNYNGKEHQVMYVVKNSKDFDAANFIIKNELNFRYYPDVSTKQQFWIDKPQEVVDYIKKTKAKLIQRHNELGEYVAKYRENCRQIKDSHLSVVDKILGALHFNKDCGKKAKDCRAITTFTENGTGNKVFVSPKNKNGTFFVLVNPNNGYDKVCRYAFDEKGNLLKTFEPPNGIKLFKEKFNEAIRFKCNPDEK